jgi:hypothetical protein
VANSLRGLRAYWKGDYQFISNILILLGELLDAIVTSVLARLFLYYILMICDVRVCDGYAASKLMLSPSVARQYERKSERGTGLHATGCRADPC